jgi:hypothetical protein
LTGLLQLQGTVPMMPYAHVFGHPSATGRITRPLDKGKMMPRMNRYPTGVDLAAALADKD